jgi:hypothetical protein
MLGCPNISLPKGSDNMRDFIIRAVICLVLMGAILWEMSL